MVLKIFSYQQVHRVLLAPEPDFATVAGAVCSLWPDAEQILMRFAGADGTRQPLGEETFGAFLLSATCPLPPGKPMLKLLVAAEEGAFAELAKAQADMPKLLVPFVDNDPKPRRRFKSKLALGAPAAGWQEDNRELDSLLKDLGLDTEPVPAPVPAKVAGTKGKSAGGRRKRCRGRAAAGAAAELPVEPSSEAESDEDGTESITHGVQDDATARCCRGSEVEDHQGRDTCGIEGYDTNQFDDGGACNNATAKAALFSRSADMQYGEASTEEGSEYDIDDGPGSPKALGRSYSCPCPRLPSLALEVAEVQEELAPTQLWPATPESTPPSSPRPIEDEAQVTTWVHSMFVVPILPLAVY